MVNAFNCRLTLEKDPESMRSMMLLGQTLLQKGELAEAIEYLERAIPKVRDSESIFSLCHFHMLSLPYVSLDFKIKNYLDRSATIRVEDNSAMSIWMLHENIHISWLLNNLSGLCLMPFFCIFMRFGSVVALL